ncbi:MAG TPA: 3-oxoacyl-[acyl-carrier-protein] synthase III C-terminal domain-containing protein [Blastocatellia bacterium]|nr:3-oxoacyl-[acyl-carrier-protein] synthase III C-terminal domain-containing protein [Blastocatellia bacterium]
MLKNRLVLYDFRIQLPRYHGSQELGFRWLTAAHAQAEVKAQGREDLRPELLARMERFVRRFGCPPQHIGTRRSEIEDFLHTEWDRMQIFTLAEAAEGCGIGKRNQFFAEVANRTVADFYADETRPPSDLLHITCTGYASPSAIQRLIDRKRWHQQTRATQIYHMGCYAAVPALRVAAGLLVNPQNDVPPRADLIHTELCTLHFNPRDHSPEQLVVQSLFADGHIRYSTATSENPPDDLHAPAFEVLAIREESVPDSLEDMTWVLSEWGFRMTLSREVPNKIAAELPGFLSRLYANAGESYEALAGETLFAVHPGGPRIIDHVQQLLELNDAQVAASRAVLFARGNMSSATLPHIWAEMEEDANVKGGTLVASLAFGPGLTIAGALFRKL